MGAAAVRSRIPGKGWGGRTPLYRPGRRNHRNTGQSLGTLSRQRGGVSDCAHRHAVLRIRCWLCPELPVQPAVAVFQGTAPCPAAVGECENRLQMLCCGSGWQEEPVAPAACSGQGVTECYWHPPVELLLLLLVPETGRFAPRAPACSGHGRGEAAASKALQPPGWERGVCPRTALLGTVHKSTSCSPFVFKVLSFHWGVLQAGETS